jgi:hypothetical protein
MSGGLPSWARKGVRVVCVDARPEVYKVAGGAYTNTGLGGLASGAIYTIDSIGDVYGRATLILRELHRGRYEHGFDVARFRPAVEPKTEAEDVALFHDIARQKLPVAV